MAVTSGSFNTNEVSHPYNGTTIKAKFTVSWSVTNTDLVNNQYTINVKLTQRVTPAGYERSVQRYYITIDGTTTSNTYPAETYGQDGTVWANYSQVITMNDDGNKNVSFKVGVAVGGSSYNCTASQTFTMGTIPRYSTLTIPTMTMGQSATITVNQAVSSFYSVVGITYNGAYQEFSPQTGSSFTVTWTPTNITSSVTDSDHADAVIQCFTYFDANLSEGGLLTEETAPVYVPSNIVPSVTISSVAEANSNLSGLPFIVGYSLLRVTFTFTGNSGSTFASSKLVCGNETVTGTSLTLTTTVPLTATSNPITVTVYDSRGRSASATRTINAVTYSPPTLTLDLTRTDSQGDPSPLGTNLSVKATWNYANITGNSATILTTVSGNTQTYNPTVNPQTAWTQIAYFSGVSAVDELVVTATINDAISSSNVTITLPKATIPISMYDDGNDVGVTFGRTSNEGDVHFYLPVHLYNDQTITEHDGNTTHTATDVMFWDTDSVQTDNIITRSSGVATLTTSFAKRWGKVVTIHLRIQGTSTNQTRGANIFVGNLNDSSFYPPCNVFALQYIDSRFVMAVLSPDGSINVRYMGYAQGNTDTTMHLTWTFVQ